MAKLPYGGIELNTASKDDPPWAKLATINEHLEDAEVIPPYLAHWLGTAIFYSNGDPNELLKRLGLKPRRGRPNSKFSDKIALKIGERVCSFEDSGMSPEAAINQILSEYYGSDSEPSRSRIQKWRDDYKKAWELSRCP